MILNVIDSMFTSYQHYVNIKRLCRYYTTQPL